MLTIAFTGHRPGRLGGYNWSSQKNIFIMDALRKQIVDVINNSDDDIHFICGGALGIDQMAFEICKELRDCDLTNRKITLEVAIPFSKQVCKWRYDDVKRYEIQLSQADKCTYVDRLENYKIKGYAEEIYYPAKMQKRNTYMVDNSDMVIAVWDGSKGGTGNCVNYTKKQDKRIIQINPKEIS